MLPVKVPVKGAPSAARWSARTLAAAYQLSGSVITRMNSHAASLLSAEAGIAQAEPPDRLMLLPSRSLNGTKLISSSGVFSARTLRYHCSIGMAPSVSAAN